MTRQKNIRPTFINILCWLGFLWVVIAFPGVFSPEAKKVGAWYPAVLGLVTALTFISLVGVWHMKRWGVRLYIASFFIKETVLVMVDDISYVGMFISLIFIITFVYHYKRMDVNL